MLHMPTRFNPSVLGAFFVAFKGQVISPTSPDYDQARRIWNGIIDKYPALIVRPLDTADVVTAVNFARDNDLLLSVRGGGHNVAGHATNDDGLVIDLSAMKQIKVDPVARTVQAGGGATWGDLDTATQMYGLATPGGVFSKTGIAGLTLGGGFGWLRNMHGLSCDNLIGAEVVTADGRVIYASAHENAELLWGLRGGGGNFGVVTTFEYRLHPVGPEVMFTFVFHDASSEEKMRDAVRLYRDYSQAAPDEVSTLFALGMFPPEPELFPEHLHLRPFALFGALTIGAVEDGKRLMQPLLDFGEPLLDFSGVKPYVEAQQAFDADYPDGMRYYWKSLNLRQLDDATIELIVRHARQQPSPFSTTDLWHVGGAVRRHGNNHGAFFGRDAAFLINPESNWVDAADDAVNIAWVRDFVTAMTPFSDGSRYLNFAGFQEEGETLMRTAFASQYERLARLKQQYDPHNLFRLNQNVKPE